MELMDRDRPMAADLPCGKVYVIASKPGTKAPARR